jgi:hypothetical protein
MSAPAAGQGTTTDVNSSGRHGTCMSGSSALLEWRMTATGTLTAEGRSAAEGLDDCIGCGACDVAHSRIDLVVIVCLGRLGQHRMKKHCSHLSTRNIEEIQRCSQPTDPQATSRYLHYSRVACTHYSPRRGWGCNNLRLTPTDPQGRTRRVFTSSHYSKIPSDLRERIPKGAGVGLAPPVVGSPTDTLKLS